MIHALLAAALAQTGVGADYSRYTNDGAIAGRVCSDLNDDGVCQTDEPGVAGVRVLTETGLEAVTDAQGRFHFLAMQSRSFEPLPAGVVRELPGRHRVKVDGRALPAGAKVVPDGATVELSLGALAMVDFAMQTPKAASATPPQVADARLAAGAARLVITGQAEAGAAVRMGELRTVAGANGAWTLEVQLAPGHHRLLVVTEGDGVARLEQREVDVVKRKSGALVVPREPHPLATVRLPSSLGAEANAQLEAPEGTVITLGDRTVQVGPSGRAVLPLEGVDGERAPLTVESSGEKVTESIAVPHGASVFATGLLDLEGGYDLKTGGFRLYGQGAAAVRASRWGFDLALDLDLRDTDVEALHAGQPLALAVPRRIDVSERSLDPLRTAVPMGDDSATVAANPSEGRVRVELSRAGLGKAGYGDYRAVMQDGEVGRFHRALFGGYLDLETPKDKDFGVAVKAFGAPTSNDLVSGYSRLPAHERFEATGGSLFYLSHGSVVQGSDWLRVEITDPMTGVVLAERHLLRGRDYSVDYLSGRVLLSQPLSMNAGAAFFATSPYGGAAVQVLVADYERLNIGGGESGTAGGRVGVRLGPATIEGSAVKDGPGYSLLAGRASAAFKGYSLLAEVAHSSGLMPGLAFSDDGGLSFTEATRAAAGDGWGLNFRARGPIYGEGAFDVSFRRRTGGYSDSEHAAQVLMQQISVRAAQPLGPVRLGGFFDDRTGPDPRDPYGTASVAMRVAGGFAGFEQKSWGVRVEGRDVETTADSLTGARTSAGLLAHYRVLPWLDLQAGARVNVSHRGEGIGNYDDTFAQAGVELAPTEATTFGVHAGYGPALGAMAWGTGSYTKGNETYYAGHGFDPDAPQLGERSVAGVKEQLSESSAVYVEDVSAHDQNQLRMGRAVGLSQQLSQSLSVSLRYERGDRRLLDEQPVRSRDAASASLGWVSERVQLFARGEARNDRGLGPDVNQVLALGGGEARLRDDLSATARVMFSHTTTDSKLTARLLEGNAGLAWRTGWGMVVARYTLQRELAPGAFAERSLQLVSLLPTLKLGRRFSLAAGGHVALDGTGQVLLAASLRPSVRVVGGLELGAEVARRSVAPDGSGELNAVRAEVGWRFDDRFMVGVGFNFIGWSGVTGLEPAGTTGTKDRVYLRAEVAY
ncbi:MAG: flagellar motor protein [Myxococcaceae bacterium]